MKEELLELLKEFLTVEINISTDYSDGYSSGIRVMMETRILFNGEIITSDYGSDSFEFSNS
jgi:hypothetical protein